MIKHLWWGLVIMWVTRSRCGGVKNPQRASVETIRDVGRAMSKSTVLITGERAR